MCRCLTGVDVELPRGEAAAAQCRQVERRVHPGSVRVAQRRDLIGVQVVASERDHAIGPCEPHLPAGRTFTPRSHSRRHASMRDTSATLLAACEAPCRHLSGWIREEQVNVEIVTCDATCTNTRPNVHNLNSVPPDAESGAEFDWGKSSERCSNKRIKLWDEVSLTRRSRSRAGCTSQCPSPATLRTRRRTGSASCTDRTRGSTGSPSCLRSCRQGDREIQN